MGRKAEVILAWTLLVGSLVAWPITAVTVARDEPPFILGLSWLAISLTAMDFLKSSRVHRDQEPNPSQDTDDADE